MRALVVILAELLWGCVGPTAPPHAPAASVPATLGATSESGVVVRLDRAALNRIWITTNAAYRARQRAERCALGNPEDELPVMWLPGREHVEELEVKTGGRMPQVSATDLDSVRTEWDEDGERIHVRPIGSDTTSLSRVVTWLEACGGKVVE